MDQASGAEPTNDYGEVTLYFLLLTQICFFQQSLPDNMADLDARLASFEKNRSREALAVFLDRLGEAGKVPFVDGESVVFFYLEDEADGRLDKVAWPADWNGWRVKAEDYGQRVGETPLWVLRKRFPVDARLDYKILLNDRQWVMDPYNMKKQVGGYGPNNVLEMGAYESSPWTEFKANERGTLKKQRIYSNLMGYEVDVQIYLPFGYGGGSDFEVLYFSDGQDFSDHRMGAATVVLDNLIEAGRIKPCMAVFIDPRSVRSKDNQRVMQYGHSYGLTGRFLRDELVPFIDETYKTKGSRDSRSIVGTSLGGLFASYVLLKQNEVFSKAAIYSPAFWFDGHHHGGGVNQSPVLTMWHKTLVKGRVYLSVGTIGDLVWDARTLRDILQEKDVSMKYVEANDGHSWGNWRDRMAETFTFLLEGTY